jgi:hypothetical protein
MNNLNNQFKNYFKALHTLGLINPHKYWMMLLRVFSVVFCALILASVYFLYKIKSEEIFQVVPQTQAEKSILNEKSLNSVREVFDQNSNIEQTLKANPPSYRDPSVQ